MRFLEPWYALLFIPLIAGLVLSWRQVHGMAKARKALAFGLRFALLGCLIIALMGPQARRPNEGLAVVFAMDRSDSISDQDRVKAEQAVKEAVAGLGPNDVAAVVAFGEAPLMESAPGGRRGLGRVASKVQASGSDLSAALRLGAAAMPEGKSRRVVLLTDGNETRGDAVAASEAARTDGLEIDVFPLGVQARPVEAVVIDTQAPAEMRVDQPFDLRVVVESTVDQTGTLVIDRDGQVVARREVVLQAGRSTVLVPQRLDKPGFFRFRATLEPSQDSDNRNNIGAAFVAVKGRPRVLVLQSQPGRSELARALREQGIDTVVGGPAEVPAAAEDIQTFDAVLLNDLNAADVSPSQMLLLQQAVRDTGIGLAMVGGENSFLPGGWYGTPVAEALPVDLDVRQRKSFPSTSVLIMVDASGSMGMMEGGVQKIRLAAQAAEATAKLLSRRDRLGVAGSTDGIEFVLPMQTLTDINGAISQIRRLSTGGGGIYAAPTVARAEQVLNAETSKVRHFILLADGADTDDYGDSLARLTRMRANKITTTVVAIGKGKDVQFLQQAARAGGGNFYIVESAARLPAIFTQDVATITRSAIEEGVFIPRVRGGDDILRGVAEGGLPALYAYCLTDDRPLARTTMESAKGDPLLATWQYGLGASLAFTSDAQSRWAAQWVGWDGFSRFWAQATRAISRRATDARYSLDVQQKAGKGEVRLEATDSSGRRLEALGGKVVVSRPDGRSEEVSLIQTGPGQFSGTFATDQMGSYIVSVAEQGKGGGARVNSTGFSVTYPPEYRVFRSNTALIDQVVSAGGGRKLESIKDSLRPLRDPGSSIQDLWLWFVLAALFLLPLDVAVRRVALPLAEAAAMLKRVVFRQKESAQSDSRLDRLQKAKASAGPAVPSGPDVKAEEKPVVAGRKRSAEPKPESGPAAGARGRLLDAKRQRKGGKDG